MFVDAGSHFVEEHAAFVEKRGDGGAGGQASRGTGAQGNWCAGMEVVGCGVSRSSQQGELRCHLILFETVSVQRSIPEKMAGGKNMARKRQQTRLF